MKIFQIVQKHFEYLGISCYYSMQQNPINGRNLSAFIVIAATTVITCVYLCSVAATFKEYSDSIYVSSLMIDITVIFAFSVWKMQTLFDCLNQTEKIINESEFIVQSSTRKYKFIIVICRMPIKGDV